MIKVAEVWNVSRTETIEHTAATRLGVEEGDKDDAVLARVHFEVAVALKPCLLTGC